MKQNNTKTQQLLPHLGPHRGSQVAVFTRSSRAKVTPSSTKRLSKSGKICMMSSMVACPGCFEPKRSMSTVVHRDKYVTVTVFNTLTGEYVTGQFNSSGR